MIFFVIFLQVSRQNKVIDFLITENISEHDYDICDPEHDISEEFRIPYWSLVAKLL